MKRRRPARRPPRPPALPTPPGAPKLPPGIVLGVRDRIEDLRDRVQADPARRAREARALELLLRRASGHEVAGAPWFDDFRSHVQREIDRDGGQEFLRTLEARADQEAGRLTAVFQFGREMAGRFRDPGTRRRFLSEVILPIRRGRIGGETAWSRTDAIAGMDVRAQTSRRTPSWTVGLGLTVEGGAGLGVGVAVGLCGARHRATSQYVEGSVGVGALAEAELTFHVQFAPGAPADFGGFSVGAGVGGAYGVAVSAGVGLVPSLRRKGLKEPLLDWAFDSATVQVGAGAGLDISVMLAACGVAPLRPEPAPA